MCSARIKGHEGPTLTGKAVQEELLEDWAGLVSETNMQVEKTHIHRRMEERKRHGETCPNSGSIKLMPGVVAGTWASCRSDVDRVQRPEIVAEVGLLVQVAVLCGGCARAHCQDPSCR